MASPNAELVVLSFGAGSVEAGMGCWGASYLIGPLPAPCPQIPPPAPVPPFVPNPLSSFVAPVDFGTDFSFLTDLDPNLGYVNGWACLGQDLAHRLETPRGGLDYDLDYGTDTRGYLNEQITTTTVGRMKSEIQAECLKDDRILAVIADVTFLKTGAGNGTLTITLNVVTSAGPFQFILAVNAVTVALLEPANDNS